MLGSITSLGFPQDSLNAAVPSTAEREGGREEGGERKREPEGEREKALAFSQLGINYCFS